MDWNKPRWFKCNFTGKLFLTNLPKAVLTEFSKEEPFVLAELCVMDKIIIKEMMEKYGN